MHCTWITEVETYGAILINLYLYRYVYRYLSMYDLMYDVNSSPH